MMMRDDEANFARRMGELRNKRGLSQSELARQLVERGFKSYSQMTVSRTEKGERPVRLGEARVIADILGSRLDEMTRGADRDEYISLLNAIKQGLIRGMLETAGGMVEYRDAIDATLDSRRVALEDDPEVAEALLDMQSYIYPASVVAAWAAEVANEPMRDVPESILWTDLQRMTELRDGD